MTKKQARDLASTRHRIIHQITLGDRADPREIDAAFQDYTNTLIAICRGERRETPERQTVQRSELA